MDCKYYEIFRAVLVKIKVSWDVTLCQVANNYLNFAPAYDLLRVHAVQKECSIELLVPEDGVERHTKWWVAIYQLRRRNVPEGLHLHMS